jgi:hypothetical protein
MPKLVCPCGFVHNLSAIPDDGWLTIRDRDHEALTPDASTPPEERLEVWRKMTRQCGSVYECPECGRVMWEKPGEEKFTVYRRDE